MARVLTVIPLGLVLAAAPAAAAQKAHAVARLASLAGKPVGTAEFAAVNRGVLITFDLHDLTPGRTPSTCTHRAIATPKAASPPPGPS
jgi:Cu/Zn superoxide dismutase